MAASPSIADSPVPDWVRRNGEIFRTPPHGMDLSKRSRRRFLEAGVVEPKLQAASTGSAAAKVKAEMSEEDGMGSIDPPALLPPASYYRDVRNHASIATTMLVTARHKVGFEPGLVGQQLSPEQMNDFVTKYFKWIMELDEYWPYLDIKGSQTRALWFHGGDQNLINQDVSQFLASFGGLNGEVVGAWREALTGLVKGSSAYVNEHGATVSTVSFQMDILDTSGNMNPVNPLTFGRTVQSNPPSGNYDSVLTSGATYLIDSNAIIASADYFATNGVSVFSVRQYRDYLNNAGL